MKINLSHNLKNYTGLTSSVIASYWIALSPIIVMGLALISSLFGDISAIGLLSKQVLLYLILFPLLFLCIDLYQIILKKREFEPIKVTVKQKPELFILLGFLVWIIVATLLQLLFFNKSRAFTTLITTFFIQEGLICFIVYAMLVMMAYFVKDRKIATNILYTFTIVATVVALFSLFDPLGKWTIHKLCNTVWASIFINSNHYSYFLTIVASLCAGASVLSNKKWLKITATILFSFFTLIMLFVDTFGSLIAVFCVYLVMPFILWWFKSKFDWKTFIPLLIFVVLSFVAVPLANLAQSYYTSFFSQIGNLVKEFFVIAEAPTSEVATHAGTDRWGLWLKAFDEIKNSPLIGTGNVLLRPHNEYLQYAQCFGLPSVIIYLSAFVVMAVKVVKHRRKLSPLSLILGFSVLSYLISAIFGNTMPHTVPFFALVLGFFIRFLNQDVYGVQALNRT